MIVDSCYSIRQEIQQNRIIITLPQTGQTLVTTAQPISYRRIELSTEEEAIILGIVKRMYEQEAKDER